ncbi:SIS domain-containing protein [Sphingobium sp. AN558]|uniref:D-sedoheptulose-7-phosphate isomerase n=1 Tax=Sphingobium sp. AN558 TaxID=3133442 RepID=UPI0030BF5C16
MVSSKAGSPLAMEIHATLSALQGAFTPDYCATVERSADALARALRGGGKLLIMGNGGSAADAQHIAAELVGRYKVERRALAAIALTTDSSILTAWSNDYSYDTVFSRQVEALARPGDIVMGLSTSGNSANVVRAFESARQIGVTTMGLLGRDGGKLLPLSDIAMVAPLAATDQIQVAHLLTYHALCAHLDIVFQ